MRFINTETLQLEYVPDSELGSDQNKYAILSHRWGASASDEVSFADIEESRAFSNKRGFAKFKGFCDLASGLGYRYGWIDTCCINKGDAMEMNEAINSMYRWYQGSHLCIIYLADVPVSPLLKSVWFDRGWTLQELIAPKEAEFYDRDYRLIGLKRELLAPLSSKTGIPEDVLNHTTKPSACSVAQRMSWAAKRETTRVEDRAYSLLAIFDVHMPQIYGEREAAFLRLQRAIIQQSKDESIFAWPMSDKDNERTYTGLLARSPSDFSGCNDVISNRGSTGFSETNGELSIRLRTFPYCMETYGAILNCKRQFLPEESIAILLSRLAGEGEYVRVRKSVLGGQVMVAPSKVKRLKDRLIRVSLIPKEPPLNRTYGFWLRTIEPPGHTACQPKILSKSSSDPKADNVVCLADGDTGTTGIIYIRPPEQERLFYSPSWSKVQFLKFGFNDEFDPIIFLSNGKRQYFMIHTDTDPRYRPSPPELEQVLSGPAVESTTKIRHGMFSNRWIDAKGSIPSRFYGWPDGVSILKVNRETGLNGQLQALNLGISVKLLPVSTLPCQPTDKGASVDDSSSASSTAYIWTVDLTELTNGDPEAYLKKVDRDEEWNKCMVDFWGCLCCVIWGYEDERRYPRHHAANQTKVLGAEDLA